MNMADVNPKPGTVDEKSGLRSFTPEEHDKAVKAAAKTGHDTHRATMRGYAIASGSAAGQIVEEGEIVPANVPVSEEWMEKLDKKEAKLTAAVNEAQDENPKDTDLTALSKPALEAMAAERGINVSGLSKADLITAIKAEREPTI
jgi:hypothetical protein